MTSLESLSLRISSTIRTRIEHELSEIVTLNDEDAAEIMLIRHAETASCHQPLDEFDRGARLSRNGVDQARRLARRLQSLWVEQIYFAPEQATEETAMILRLRLYAYDSQNRLCHKRIRPTPRPLRSSLNIPFTSVTMGMPYHRAMKGAAIVI